MRIIPRSEWGAVYPNGAGPAPLPATEVWLHHSVSMASDLVAPYDDDFAAVRQLEKIGQSRFGRGISYTFVISPAGLIFEGHSVDRVGSHTGGRNTIARAICFIGNYDVAQPTPAQLDAAAWLLDHGHRSGWWKHPQLNGGHRDLKATACPGKWAYAQIGHINNLALAYADTPAPQPEDDMTPEQEALLRDALGRVANIEAQVTSAFTGTDGRIGWVDENFRIIRADIAGIDGDLQVDIDTLASALAARLGDDLARELGEALVRGSVG